MEHQLLASRGPSRKRVGRLLPLSRQAFLAREFVDFLSAPRLLAGCERGLGGPALVQHFSSGGCLAPPSAFSGRRLVLVCGHFSASHWVGASGLAIDRRPLHV